ncbi:hypothetical protein AGMMS50249_4940 [candidate division SR1 bacterium]|nr:hypothetical protein AGMMS50249_4940 [candidate division SR1 bacterium]
MYTETISLSKTATLAMLLQRITTGDKKYIVSVDGMSDFEVKPLENLEFTSKLQQSYDEAMEDLKVGKNWKTLDMNTIKTLDDFDKWLDE